MSASRGRPGPVSIRPAAGEADLATLVALIDAVTPEDPTSLDEIAWADATYAGTTRYLAERDGVAVGAATVGRIFVMPEAYPDRWGSLHVVGSARRQGIGDALLRTIAADTVAAGKDGLQLRVSEARPESIAFLEHRGFTELERARMVRLPLAGVDRTLPTLPDGLVLTTLAERPELVAGVHQVALEAFDDIPGGDEPMAAGDLDEFRRRDVDRPGIPPEAFFIAVDPREDRVVGYASLLFVPGSRTVAWHDMTAVLRSWRGKGIATRLKAATIAWAAGNGLEALETGNDEGNAPMRAVNLRLGYLPLPDELMLRGPVAPLVPGWAVDGGSRTEAAS